MEKIGHGGNQPIHIWINSSFPTPPFPSKSNSSIMATSSSSSSPSPSSRATRRRSSSVIIPLSSVSNRAKARRISSRGSRFAIRLPAMAWNFASVSCRRPGGTGSRRLGRTQLGFGSPLSTRRVRISGLGRSNPRAFRATLNSWQSILPSLSLSKS